MSAGALVAVGWGRSEFAGWLCQACRLLRARYRQHGGWRREEGSEVRLSVFTFQPCIFVVARARGRAKRRRTGDDGQTAVTPI
jgi:hypothetical protein